MEHHICQGALPNFRAIFNYKVENYGKKHEKSNNSASNSLYSRNKTLWKIKYISFNFDKEEFHQFPKEKLEALKKALYSIPGLGNEEDFIEYQYHYRDYINSNESEQTNLIQFDNDQLSKENPEHESSLNTFNISSLGDINEYPLLNPSFYISPSIVSSVYISLLTNQIKVKYNPDFTNSLLIKNIIIQSGLNILETVPSPYINVIYGNVTNEKISTTTYELPNGNSDDLVKENSFDQDMNMSSTKYQNKYNKNVILELISFSLDNNNHSKITSGICHPDCKNCIQWLKNCISQYLFDQIDIESIQLTKLPWIEFNNNKIYKDFKFKSCRLSLSFKYHESAESFIFDDISNILNEMNIRINRIQIENVSLSNEEKIKRNSFKLSNGLESIVSSNKNVSLHSISFLIPKLNRASEAMRIESKLLKISGIKNPIKFDFINKQCIIIYNSYQVSVKDIISEIKLYHPDATTISNSFRRLKKEEENSIFSIPANNMNDTIESLDIESLDKKESSNIIPTDQDEAEKTEIYYSSDIDQDENILFTSNKYANSINSSTSSTEYMGKSTDYLNEGISNFDGTKYKELKNQVDKRSKNLVDKRFIFYSKIEKCFNICSILTIFSFITPYFFVWINYITNNLYMRLNLHLECIIVLLLSIPVQFYYGSEIHSIALHILKHNICECNFFKNDIENDQITKNNKEQNNNKYSQCFFRSNGKKNYRISGVVVLSFTTWIIWIYSTLGIFIRLLQMYINNSNYETPHIYHEYYETSSLLITCYYVKKLLELMTKQYTIDNISQFMHLQMKKAVLLTPLDPTLTNCNTINEGTLRTEWIESIVDVNSLKEGDIIKILPGNRIPYDGSIVYGKTKLDESMISGNTKPIKKSIMDRVMSGTMNIESSIYVKILDASSDCTFNSMINLIEDVQLSSGSFHIFTDNIYKYLIPVTLIISILTLLLWTFGDIDVNGKAINKESLKNNYQIEFGIIFSISVLIIAFPFTMEFVFPIAISIASKIAMKYGILVKDIAHTFKKLSQLNIIVFNKDQVITNGSPSIVEIIIDENFNQFGRSEAFYEILKSLEYYSSNIYAKCIRNYIKKVEMSLPDKRLIPWDVLYYQETEGYSIVAKIRSSTDPNGSIYDVCLGSEKWMIKQKCIPSLDQSRISVWTERGYSIFYLSINKVIVGMLSVHDNVRDGTKVLIQCLKEQYHIEPWLLSSDNEASTLNIAKQIGIDENHCFYNVLPSEKQEKIKWLQNTYIYKSKKHRKSFNSNFKLISNSLDPELNEYKVYQESTNQFDPFNSHHNSSSIFSDYNRIPSTSHNLLINESSISQTNDSTNNDVNIKIEEEDEDNDCLISHKNDVVQNVVAYIGNDINDSDVFSTADIGLCLGILNDISLDSSVITTIYQDIQCISKLLHLTQYTINYSYTTILYIILLHIILIPIATGLFYPYTWLNPLWIIASLIISIVIHYYRANSLKKVKF
ncbi:hypothetical protein BCR32DRAFT_293671 [Anaeromyces robustus]|uniref:P-type ATPase A domain-containing protein n=1 Tax=Anaeromyces robustus TaxID=1754192 RepID=A0A1Y1X4H5_9FUNG|nr:hypothetical protein BCR32DRAFT_293671 [Anaeromyces robustus]|eukprot:ORX80720.1 hypothetical protein BCR32DRAFT_293671 [Anaeromyces robustus]